MKRTANEETFDALACPLTDDDVAKVLADHALAILRYDDSHPDVGMGKFVSTAINEAEESVRMEAARWKRPVLITDKTKKKASKIVEKERHGR